MKTTDFFDRNTKESILIGDVVSVFEPNNNILVGWGWFEYDDVTDETWFREDIHSKFPQGMDSDVIDNIKKYEFEKY